MISTLSTINECLGLLGELPVNDLLTYHPLIPKAQGLLDSTNSTVQGDSWWFNTEYPELHPQVLTNELLLPNDTLAVDSLTAVPAVTYRAGRLYNLDKSTFEFTQPLKVRLRRLVQFEDLPHNARAYVAARAKLAFQGSIDGDQIKTQLLQVEVRQTYAVLNSEHIRNVRANMFNRPGVQFALMRIGNPRRNRSW